MVGVGDRCCPLHDDPGGGIVTARAPAALTKREQQMVDILRRAAGLVPLSALAVELYGASDESARQSVRVIAHRLRSKGVRVTSMTGHGLYGLDACEGNHVFVCACCGAKLSPLTNHEGRE